MTGAKEAQKVKVLDRFPCIFYPMQFRKDKSKNVLTLLDFESEVNAMTPSYSAQLGLKVQNTNIGAQKINWSLLAI